MREFFRHVLALVALGLPAVPAALAQTVPVWSSSAASCVATATSINGKRYLTVGSHVRHRGSNIDAITLNCPITDASIAGSDWELEFTYQDSTGIGPGATAAARLMIQSRTTGVITQLPKISSDSFAVSTINTETVSYAHTFDFSANVYFVEIILDRNATNKTVRAFSVALIPGTT